MMHAGARHAAPATDRQGGYVMAKLKLQLVTVDLDNGQTGVFIGLPLITDAHTDDDCQVEDIWFSDLQDLPDGMSLAQVMRMIQDQLHCSEAPLQ
jgi:hypothetical protein